MRFNIKYLLTALSILALTNISAQSTSWIGASSTDWSTASNWTSGVPTASVDAIIGDASFTGSNQPVLTSTSSCKNLTIGNGSKASSLNIARNITVNGSLLIGSNGTILASSNNRTITIKGNWTNSGTYSATSSSAGVTLSGGVVQTFTGATTFRRLTVNSGSTLLLASSITVNNSLSVSGTVNPTASYSIGGSGSMTVNSTGIILVYASTFAGNYAMSGTVSLNRTSTVNYASASLAQTVSSSYTYGTLRISGGSTKSLAANLPGLSSSNSSSGRIFIDAGIFDLKTFTANRSSSGGGSITISAGAKLMIGGSNSFPSNYLTHTIASTSTVEYYGNNQTVIATTYGHLVLKATTGSVTKTMPATALTIAGDFTMDIGTGTSVSATAAQNITFNGNVNIGSGATFSASSFSHTFKSNLLNNGTLNGGTSTSTFSGISSSISGSGTNNFHNMSFTAFGITGSGSTDINVSGNLSTTTPGLFTHLSGGTLSLTGASKTLSGNGFTFNNLLISGSISSTANFYVTNNFTNNGTYTSSSGTLSMSGVSASIGGSAAPVFYGLNIEGNISTAVNLSLLSNLSVSSSGSFTATAGTLTFNGTSTLNGIANLYNIAINATRTLVLGSSSVLGIKGSFSNSGTFNVTTYVPNTVNYNNTGAQTIAATSYNNLILSGSGTKTPAGAVTVNNDFTISSGVTFNASSFVFSLYRHWNNEGTFTASTSDVQFRGSNAATITGASTFNTFTVNKTSSQVKVTLADNVIASAIVMSNGNINTGNNSITTTGTRTGSGIIIGTVVHNHTFANATPYAFEGPNNLITFNNPSGISSVTVTSRIGEIADFDPAIESVIREYEVSIASGTYTSATLRYHYENNELNAFAEPFLSIYKHNSGVNWDSLGYTSRDTSANYVELSNINSIDGRFSASGIRNIVRWNGSVSTDWSDSMNWTTISGSNMNRRVPTSTDAAQLGEGSFTYQPSIAFSHSVSVLRFGSAQSCTLTISGGDLSSSGSIRGQWSAAKSHVIDVSSGNLTAGTNLLISDGIIGHDIHLKIGSGAVNVSSDLIQYPGSAITFTGNGNLVISGSFEHTGGTFTAGSGTVIYSGGDAQVVAEVVYNNLNFNKSTSTARITSPTVVNGNLSTTAGGELLILDSLSVAGNLNIGASTFIETDAAVLSIGGDLILNGTFIPNNGKVRFNGSGDQNITPCNFNDIDVVKSGGALNLTGTISINGNLNINSGIMDLDTFRADRSFDGGIFSMDSGSALYIGGSSHFPAKFITSTLHSGSHVIYNGIVEQQVKNITYGGLGFENGSGNSKSLIGNIRVNGDLTINSGADFNPDIYSLNLYGNFINSGNFIPGTSTITLNGTGKTISGTTTFNNLSVVEGSYTVASGTITMSGDLYIESTGSLSFGTNTAILDGDLTNKGNLTSNGTATFTGNRVQTLQLLNSISSSSTGVINFNGTFSPIINSNTSPAFATVNINNTAGITPSVPWYVFVAFNVSAGASFHGGPLTHTFYGNFTNNGDVTSDGILKFSPGAPYSASGSVKLDGTSFISTGEVDFAGTAPLTITQNSPVFNVVKISNTHSGGVTAPGSWNIADELRIGPSATFKAGTSTSHVITGSLINSGTLDGQTSTVIFDGTSSEINGSGTSNFNHITIATGADLTLNTSINVMRNFTADGNFNGDAGSVSFTGSAASVIDGASGAVSFGDLEQNKSGVLTTLAIPVTVNGELILTLGKIVTSTTNYLNIADDATSTPGSALSFVSGPMRKTGNDSFVFPLGKGIKWARLAISAPSNATDVFTAEYFDAAYSNTTSMSGTPSPVLNNVSLMEYWDLNRTAGTSSVKVTLYWENSLSGINNYSGDLVVAHWNGSSWENAGQDAITASTPGNVTSLTQSSFSPFTFGSLSPAINPLPITLLVFEGKLNESSEVELNWKTASETNNRFFTVEKSRDGVHFTELTKVMAAGNSQTVQTYAALDKEPFSGLTYYRLRQTDVNGESTVSATIVIVYNGESKGVISVYPNPSSGLVNIVLDNPGAAGIQVLNSMGMVVETIQTEGGTFIKDFTEYPKGVYYLMLSTETVSEAVKIIIR